MSELEERIFSAVAALRAGNADFREAYEAYTSQYGGDIVTVNEPLQLSGTVDPVILIVGRNCSVLYRDTSKSLEGSLGNVKLSNGSVSIIGRRNEFDSKVLVWSPSGDQEAELGCYNPLAGTIPSRIHGALIVSSSGAVYYSDLCSSSGTVVVGELIHGVPFIRAYDPGSPQFPIIRFERTSMSRRS